MKTNFAPKSNSVRCGRTRPRVAPCYHRLGMMRGTAALVKAAAAGPLLAPAGSEHAGRAVMRCPSTGALREVLKALGLSGARTAPLAGASQPTFSKWLTMQAHRLLNRRTCAH